jgi:hypothetical protein
MWNSRAPGDRWFSRRASRAFTIVFVAIMAPLASASSLHAQTADAVPLAPAPAPRRPRSELVWAGASVFALSYLASALSATTGYTADDGTLSARTPLWVPAVGPFVMMGSTRSVAADVILAVDGLAQIGGLTMFVYGFGVPSAPRVDTQSGPRVSVAPLVAHHVSGATLVLTF